MLSTKLATKKHSIILQVYIELGGDFHCASTFETLWAIFNALMQL